MRSLYGNTEELSNQWNDEWSQNYWNKFVLANLDKDWWWHGISRNPNITWDIFQANPDKPWDWETLSENPNITWDIVQANPDKPWNWAGLSLNSNITWDIVQANRDKPWQWGELSRNPNITMEIVKANPDEPWRQEELSRNPNMRARKRWGRRPSSQRATLKTFKQANPDIHWDWETLSENPNITMDIIKDNPDKPWDWYGLSRNPFTKEREMFMEQKMREHNAAFKIQTYWRRANYNPDYALCKRRLMREYDDFGFK